MTQDMQHLTTDIKNFVLMLLSAHAERLSVSCILEFLNQLNLLEICNRLILNQTTLRALKRHGGFQPLQAETFDSKPLG